MVDLFKRLDAGRPPPAETTIKQPHNDREPAQLLLDFLQRWHKNTISIRDIRNHGPRSIRNREIATNAVKVLTEHGWLIPLKTQQRNWHRWQIIQKGIVVYPNVANTVGEVLRLLGIWRGASFAMCDSATGLAARQRSTPWRRDYLLHSTPVKS